MELIRTDVGFSRIAMVLFMCRNKSSRNDLKLYGDYFRNNKKSWQKIKTRGPTPYPRGCGVRLPPGRAPYLVGLLELYQPQLQLYIFTFREKKIKEKDSSHFTIRSRRQALVSLGRLIWSLLGAPERWIRRRRHHQPSSIGNFMMLTAVRE